MLDPTNELRFVLREGKRILQQKWTEITVMDTYVKIYFVWRDIPLENDPLPETQGIETYSLHEYRTRDKS